MRKLSKLTAHERAIKPLDRTMKWTIRTVLSACCLLCAGAVPAAAQRLLDWPVRTTAGASALARGAAAAFWNPAAAGEITGRADAMVVDIEGPEITTVSGLAIAGAVALDGRTTVFAGYRHLGMEEIVRTTTSPLRDETAPWIEVSGDLFTLGVSRELASGLQLGGVLRASRETLGYVRETALHAGAGLVYRAGTPLEPTVGLAVFTSGAEPRWLAGVEVGPRPSADRYWVPGLSYGLSGESDQRLVAHRVAATSRWQDRFELTIGAAVESTADGPSVLPVVAGIARFGRYTVGLVREESPAGFGAAYYYRLHVRL